MNKNIYLSRQQDSNLYKIGITKNDPRERMKQLQTGNANKIELVETFNTKHGYKMEVGVHAHYKNKKVSTEWFALTDDDVKEFYSVCERLEFNFDFLSKNNTYLNDRFNF